MLNYTTIDFETANTYRGSPCAVGLVRVRDGRPVQEVRQLMRPPVEVDYFAPFNTSIHGIDESMVANQPRWMEVLPSIVDFIGSDVVVAHNAGFDVGVIRYACAVDNIEWPELRFLCSMVLARRALSLPSYTLPFVVETLGGTFDNHHEALADARGVVEVIQKLSEKYGANDLDELAQGLGIRIGRMKSGIYLGSVATTPGKGQSRLVQSEANRDADRDGYLYGRVVVFTGALMSMTRQIAWDECARLGAIAEKSITKRTNVLVVGDINPASLRPGSNLTKKARQAFEYQDRGQAIEVMTEYDFVRCLQGQSLGDATTLLGSDDDNTGRASTPVLPASVRKLPIADRPTPKPPKPPKPLRREPIPTAQVCSAAGCTVRAAFRTRSRPTWCDAHIIEFQQRSGIQPLELFTHPDDWQLTKCLACGVQAHYRFTYTLDKLQFGEPTCRACYWRKWAADQRSIVRVVTESDLVSYARAESICEEHGFDYLGPLTNPSLRNDPHHTRCRRCGKISAERLSDVSFGCTCQPRK